MSQQGTKVPIAAGNKRQRRHVLEEEEYTSTLSSIVERDYYPDLLQLRKQAAVLERRAAQDFAGAVAIRRAARQVESHQEACAELEKQQEADTSSNDSTIRRVPRPLHRESLSGFHARVTSEDNHDFEQTQQKEVRANRKRLHQVFGGDEQQQPRMLTNGITPSRQLASDQFVGVQHCIEAPKNPVIGNGLFFSPSRASSSQQEHQQQQDSTSPPLQLTNGNRGSTTTTTLDQQLMPPPINKTKPSSCTLQKQDLVEYIPKHVLQRRIEPSQTRFPSTSTGILVARPPATEADDDSSSLTTDYSTEASTDLDSVIHHMVLEKERRAGIKRRRRECETLVTMTPLMEPGRGGDTSSPITTWGTVDGTPMVLSGQQQQQQEQQSSQDEAATSFALPNESEKDQAARRAQAKLTSRRHKAASAKRMPSRSLTTSSSNSLVDRTASLTPAARALLAKSMGVARNSTSSARSSSALSSALRSSYTPKLKKRGGAASTRDHAEKATPKRTPPPTTIGTAQQTQDQGHNKNDSSKQPVVISGHVTDGLLKIP